MDFKRNLLVLALAVVSYLMLLAWNDDYSVPVESGAVATPDLPQTPAVPADNATAQSTDVPQVQGPAATAPVPATPSAGLITVSTPVQVVSIDPVGGDIVELSLPDFPISIDNPNAPFPLMYNDGRGVYVAQSGLIGRNGPDALGTGRPRYTSAQTSYTLEEGTLNVDLVTTTSSNVRITKRFVFSADDYLIGIQHLVANTGSTDQAMNLFAQIKRDGREDPSQSSGVRTFLGAVMTTPDDPYYKRDLEELAENNEEFQLSGGWIGFSQHYFLSSWIAPSATTNSFTTRRNANGEYLLGFVGPEIVIPAGQEVTFATALWAGPKDQFRLEAISPDLGLTIDYGMLWFVAYPIFWLLSQIYAFVGNYGLAIVLLTCVIRLLMYPLSAKQFRSQLALKRIQPKIAQLKERYGDDKQRFMQAQMELWKKEGANPFGGCLPVLLQMPVFLGIYWVLNESVELRQAPFMLWYEDLSKPDPYFILPLALGAAYYLQQHLTPMMTTDPMQAKIMKFMPVIFCVFFLFFPAGLVLYYLANALLSILQQWYFNFTVRNDSVPATDG